MRCLSVLRADSIRVGTITVLRCSNGGRHGEGAYDGKTFPSCRRLRRDCQGLVSTSISMFDGYCAMRYTRCTRAWEFCARAWKMLATKGCGFPAYCGDQLPGNCTLMRRPFGDV